MESLIDSGQVNLCKEVIDEMIRLGFDERNINFIKSNQEFINAQDKAASLQRAMLTHILYGIILYSPTIVPTKIRLALNIASSVEGWLDDIRLTILPFLKENQDKFFAN